MPEPTEAQMRGVDPARSSETERAAELETRRQVDFCHKDAELGRFRTNVFYERKGLNAVLRLVPYEIPNLTDVGLPESIWEITTYSQGLILVTGPAGCGKTTTLAALVDRINETERGHIITVEDPIEYVHANKESLVNQREIPAHSRSFAKALRQSLREDPGRDPRRRDARPRDDLARHHGLRDRPPRARDAAHDDGLLDGRPHHQRLPARPAGPDPA